MDARLFWAGLPVALGALLAILGWGGMRIAELQGRQDAMEAVIAGRDTVIGQRIDFQDKRITTQENEAKEFRREIRDELREIRKLMEAQRKAGR